MAQHKTAVTPLLTQLQTQWSYCSFVLHHWYVILTVHEGPVTPLPTELVSLEDKQRLE